MKLKIRYIAAALFVIASIASTPVCIESAYQFRGYKAYGGEYLIIPLGVLLAVVTLEIAKEWDSFLIRHKNHENIYQESEE